LKNSNNKIDELGLTRRSSSIVSRLGYYIGRIKLGKHRSIIRRLGKQSRGIKRRKLGQFKQ